MSKLLYKVCEYLLCGPVPWLYRSTFILEHTNGKSSRNKRLVLLRPDSIPDNDRVIPV